MAACFSAALRTPGGGPNWRTEESRTSSRCMRTACPFSRCVYTGYEAEWDFTWRDDRECLLQLNLCSHCSTSSTCASMPKTSQNTTCMWQRHELCSPCCRLRSPLWLKRATTETLPRNTQVCPFRPMRGFHPQGARRRWQCPRPLVCVHI